MEFYFHTRGVAVSGIDALVIDVDVDVQAGSTRNLMAAAMSNTEVRESCERIRSGLQRSCGVLRTAVNVAGIVGVWRGRLAPFRSDSERLLRTRYRELATLPTDALGAGISILGAIPKPGPNAPDTKRYTLFRAGTNYQSGHRVKGVICSGERL